jgi:hypothetical protein
VRTQALAVGPWHTAEFTAATSGVTELQSCPRVATIDTACELLAAAEVAPELILLAQPLPGGVRQQDVDRLQRLAPLARVVIVAWSWCEGELRTGNPPVGALRLYWYELAPWWQAAERRLAAGLCPAWSAPLDHPQAGRFTVDGTVGKLTLPSPVAVHADDFTVFESLAEVLVAYGAHAIWTRGEATRGVQAGIWDGGQLRGRERQRLGSFCRQIAGPVVALLDFPRVEHIAEAREAGAAAVFAKPYIVEELIARLAASRVVLDHGAGSR